MCTRSMGWRQERECVHFGAADIDHPLFFVWFCCNIAHMFVPDFRGSCVINGPMHLNTDLSLSLSLSLFFSRFPAPSSPFFHGRDRGRVYSCGEYVIPRKGFEFLSGEIVFHLSLRFVVAFGNACYTLEKIQL